MRKIFIPILFLFTILAITRSVQAAALTLDPTFNSGTGFAGGSPKEPVITDNGTKYIMVGTFTSYNGTPANRIIKLNMDGSIDTAFMANVGTGISASTVYGVDIQSDGKIILATTAGNYNGTSYVGGIVRLNADGTFDTAFKAALGTSTPGGLLGVNVMPNGRILLLGSSSLTSFNGQTATRIYALNPDGTPDAAFNTNLASGIWVQAGLVHLYEATPLSNGQIIVSGGNSSGRSAIFRLNSDGTLDNTFNLSGTGTDAGVWDHKVFPNGKIVMVGQFTTFNGVSSPRVALLNADGTIDTNFNPGTGIAVNTPTGVAILPSGVFIVAGPSTTYNGVSLPYFIAINQDGSAPALDFGSGFTGGSSSQDPGVINSDGKLLLAGSFITYNGTTVNGVLRFNQDFTPPVISNIHLSSNNSHTDFAKSGDIVTLSFQSTDTVTGSTVTLGGQSVTPSCSGTMPTVLCSATLTVTGGAPATDGAIGLSISLTSEGGTSTTSTTTSDASSVTIDRIAPTTTIASPANGTTVGGTIAAVTGTCESGLSVTITGTNIQPGAQNVSCTGGTFTTNSMVTTGTPSVIATQTDIAGNVTSANATYIQDVTSPNITIITPNRNVEVGTVTVTGTCEDGLTITVSGLNFNQTTTSCSGGAYSVDINVTGQLFLTVSQTDAVGNTGSARFNNSSGAVILIPANNNAVVNGGGTTQPTGTGSQKTFISPVDGTTLQCPPFTNYLKVSSKTNKESEVKLWQAFLNKYQNENVPVTGFFGPKTFAAVKRFQLAYKSEILTPWKLTKPTGHVYQSTRAKANQILGCSEGTVVLDNGITISGN